MATQAIFSVGELVKLKSGGPVMTVYKVQKNSLNNNEFNGHYTCQWFAGKKLDQGNFAQESLEKSEDPE